MNNIEQQLKRAQATVHAEHSKAVCYPIQHSRPQRFRVFEKVRNGGRAEDIATGNTVFEAWSNAAAKIKQKKCLGQRG